MPHQCRPTSKALIKSYPGAFDQIKEQMHVETFLKEKTLVHGVLASPLTNAETHNLKHPEDRAETSYTSVYITFIKCPSEMLQTFHNLKLGFLVCFKVIFVDYIWNECAFICMVKSINH